MNHVADIDATAVGEQSRRWRFAPALDATGVALNRYRIAPGDGFPGGLHAHADQAELFVVLDGEATFETLSGTVTVGAGEAVRFAPGEFQSGYNAGETDLVALVLGAPRESDDVRIPFACPDCAATELRVVTTEGGVAFECPECDAEHVPSDCPDCGGDDLRATLGSDGDPVAGCRDCGAEFDSPPLRG